MQFTALFAILSTIAGPLVKRVLVSLGIGAVSLVGVNVMLQGVTSFIKSQFGSVMPEVASILGLAKVDIAINIVLAAVATRALVAGMSKSGSLEKLGSVGKGS